MTRGVWGEREERWLRERYAYEHAPQLVAEFEREFGKKVSKGALYTRANKLGLLKMARDLPPKAVRRITWCREPEMQGWMERNDRGQCETELSREFAEAFGFPLSHPQISLWRSTNGRTTKRSRGGRKRRPVGSERYDERKGHVLVKVAEEPTAPQTKDNWRFKHHVEYEKHFGPIPDGCDVVMANRDKRDFRPENLVAVPHRLMSRINSPDSPPWDDAESLRACVAWCELDARVHSAEMATPRECGVCGKTFTPPPSAMQSAHLRNMKTCPECLAAGKKSRGESKRAERRTCEVCGEPYMALRRSQRRCPRCIEELRGCTVEYHKRWRERHGFASTLGFGGVDTSTIDALTASTQDYADKTIYDLGDIRNTTAQLAANGVSDYAQLSEAAGKVRAGSNPAAPTTLNHRRYTENGKNDMRA